MTGLAKEYGNGLYELAQDEDLRGLFNDELAEIDALLIEQPDFVKLLSSRAIEREARLNVAQETFGGRVHPYIVNFIKLMVEKEHFDAFRECVKCFRDRYNDDFKVVEADVTSAVPLSESDVAQLKEKLKQMSGKDVALTCHVDPTVIGGVRVEMEGRRYDNTIQSSLERLKYSLAGDL